MGSDLIPSQLEHYIDSFVPERSGEIQEMEAYAKEFGFPIIGPACGHFCYQVARMTNAKNICELGSGYGYSTAWFAKALKENGGGIVHHMVWDKDLSKTAQAHLAALGFDGLINYHVGEALALLKNMDGPFDLIFNDIDKHAYPDSFPAINDKLRSGGVLIVDNMLWGGNIFDEKDASSDTNGVREFTKTILEDPNWVTSLIPIRDGLVLAYKK